MKRKTISQTIFSITLAFAGFATQADTQYPIGISDSLSSGYLGLYNPELFTYQEVPQTIPTKPSTTEWFFHGQGLAIPKQNAARVDGRVRVFEDVKQWVGSPPEKSLPNLLWMGSPQVADQWQIQGNTMTKGGRNIPLSIVKKIPSNLSYYNDESRRFFEKRSVTMRGTLNEKGFEARSLWPNDFNLNTENIKDTASKKITDVSQLVRANQGGAKDSFQAQVLWKRHPEQALQLNNQPVLGILLNGAQGDDDESHGGHFAVATGRFGERGEWRNWLVNNFYDLDLHSEKGIIASTLPMDAYLGDLNSGQAWYRPSYMLVAVLKDTRAPALVQGGIDRVFAHFYRHDFTYQHATENCTGIGMDALRSLGWNIPKKGPTSVIEAFLAFPLAAIKEKSLKGGRDAFDYLYAEQTKLYPFAAFTAIGNDLQTRIVLDESSQIGNGLEKLLAEDIEAIVYMHIPQFPSSRAFGQAPIDSMKEYISRVPKDKSKWKIVPAPARPFPVEMKDPESPSVAWRPSDYAQIIYAVLVAVLLCFGIRSLLRRKV